VVVVGVAVFAVVVVADTDATTCLGGFKASRPSVVAPDTGGGFFASGVVGFG